MTTEYRPGIPSHAHIEAATRLGLLWEDNDGLSRWRLAVRSGSVNWDELSTRYSHVGYSFRPIRPDGTPVDWETLDAEVARVAGAAGSVQQGFRADLWRRLDEWITVDWLDTLSDVACIDDRGISGHTRRYNWDELGLDTRADEADRQALIVRWAVYQELKPLYDIVDGAMGEAAMPRDVEAEWDRQVGVPETTSRGWLLRRDANSLSAQGPGGACWRPHEADYGIPLRNFATVLDAVAEAREGQAQPVPVGTLMMQNPDGTVSPARPGQQPIGRLIETRTVAQSPTPPEPRRFADVRPDRHRCLSELVADLLAVDQAPALVVLAVTLPCGPLQLAPPRLLARPQVHGASCQQYSADRQLTSVA